ncbi:MAG: DUF4389 domain-containing protein [Ghiorsea sp.]
MSEDNKVDAHSTYDVKTLIQDKSIWIRLLYMALFAILYSVAEVVIIAVIVYQFLNVLITGGNKDEKVAGLGLQLSTYVYQILQFQTFNTETKPYPMSDWPSGKRLVEEAVKPKRAPRKRAATRRKSPTKPTARQPAPRTKTAPTKKVEDKPAEDAPK